MKKILISLLVLAMCAPAMAVVDFTTADNADGTFTISMNTNGDVVRGVAIKVVCGAGQALDIAGSAVQATTPPFNCFIDYAHDQGAAYTIGMAGEHPFALDGVAGAAANGATTFVVSMGVLDQAGGQAGYNGSGALIKIKVGAGTCAISADTLRGPDAGVVGDATLTSTGLPANVVVTAGPVGPTCNDYNVTKLVSGATDNAVNVSDLNNLIAWVNTNKTGALFTVTSTNPNWLPNGPLYNMTKKLGATDNAVNVSDLNAIITFVNTWKTGALFTVNCLTCGC